tara:strand:- start:141 stop:428 length:288 start_codon:yes stop_codon:yes gene_type:complete
VDLEKELNNNIKYKIMAFKMKGSPMYRNFGISPTKASPTKDIGTRIGRVKEGLKALKARITGKGNPRYMGERPSGGPFDPNTWKKLKTKAKKLFN